MSVGTLDTVRPLTPTEPWAWNNLPVTPLRTARMDDLD